MKDNQEARKNQDRALQDIQTIKAFLEQGQRKLEDSGFHFIFWGLLIPIGFIVFSFLAPRLGYDAPILRFFWPVLCGTGGIVSFVVGTLSSPRSAHSGYAEKVSTALWVGNLLAVGILFAALFLGNGTFSLLFLSMIAVILGLSYWVYGTVIQLRWFTLVALGWWIAALGISFVGISVAGFILSAATFVCSFIPGCVLFYSKKNGRK